MNEQDYVKLGSGALTAWVAKPYTFYDRTRFDQMGFIPHIELRGVPVTTIESPLPGNGTGGGGLCSEFKTEDMGVEEGDELLMKPGVGILRRSDNAPFNFGLNYPAEKRFPITMRREGDSLDMYAAPLEFKGYAYAEHKHICVLDDVVIITTTMRNEGQKRFTMREYNHNFLSMNGGGANPKATLTLPKSYYQRTPTAGIVEKDGEIGFTDEFKTSFMIFTKELEHKAGKRFTIADRKTGYFAEEWGDFDLADMWAWGCPHVISPEVFNCISLAPGEQATWTRMWRFGRI